MEDVLRDAQRVGGALDALKELVEAIQRGDVYINDFSVNRSVNDPLRMNIEIKTVRGRAEAPETPLRFASGPDPRAAPPKPNRSSWREREREELQRKINERGLGPSPEELLLRTAQYEYDENGVKWPMGQMPKKPPKPKIDRSKGARELDLD